MRIKQIESQFGSVVASYFTFLRWLLWVNLVIAITLISFVTIPEVLTADWKYSGDRKEMLEDEKKRSGDLVTLVNFEGILKYSPLFYGYYSNRNGTGGYRLPLAYFVTGLVVYVYSFIATLRKLVYNLFFFNKVMQRIILPEFISNHRIIFLNSIIKLYTNTIIFISTEWLPILDCQKCPKKRMNVYLRGKFSLVGII